MRCRKVRDTICYAMNYHLKNGPQDEIESLQKALISLKEKAQRKYLIW